MRRWLSNCFYGLVIFLLLPCILSFFLSGKEILSWEGTIDGEECLPLLMMTQLPENGEMEFAKAMAVVLRTNGKLQREEGKSWPDILWKYCKDWKMDIALQSTSYQRYQQAAEKTAGRMLTLEEEPVFIPYHAVSSGRTRSGSQVIKAPDLSYLTPVESPEDKQSPFYTASVWIPKKQLSKQLEIGERDDSGYVLTLLADGEEISGEDFRVKMGLPSSCFSMEEMGETVRFFCKGKGHGLGVSLYGAAAMGEAGADYEEILAYYLPALRISETGKIFFQG